MGTIFVDLAHSHTSVFFWLFMLFWLFIILTLPDQVLLLLLLLSRAHGGRLSSLLLLHLFHLLPLSLLFFLLDTATLLFFPSAFSFFLLLFFGLSLLCLSLSFLSCQSLRLCLSFCLGPRFCLSHLLLVHTFIGLFFTLFLTANTKNLCDMRTCVNAGSCCPEHSLQESIGLLRLVSSHNFRWLNIHLLASDRLSQLD